MTHFTKKLKTKMNPIQTIPMLSFSTEKSERKTSETKRVATSTGAEVVVIRRVDREDSERAAKGDIATEVNEGTATEVNEVTAMAGNVDLERVVREAKEEASEEEAPEMVR